MTKSELENIREFWIQEDDNQLLEVLRYKPFSSDYVRYKTFHVIEYSAYKQLMKEIESLKLNAFNELVRACKLQDEVNMLKTKLKVAEDALEFYAGTKDGKWVDHVCDSYSGLNYAFDWNGDTQDEPHEVAVKALAEIRKKDDNG